MLSHKKAPHSKGKECGLCGGGACKMAEGGKVGPGKDFGDGPYLKPTQDTEPRGKWGDGKDLEPAVQKLSEGGEAEPDGDEEISHGLGKELMEAFEKKDHKKLMGSLEAIVLHHMGKGEE